MRTTYKYLNKEKTEVNPPSGGTVTEGGCGWDEFQEYLFNGGEVDPYKTYDEWVQDALFRCFAEHDRIIQINSMNNPIAEKIKNTKLTKAQRAEARGSVTPKQEELLDNNDILDTWYDEMETAAEGENYGERWIEDPQRTEQELIDYDSALVPWPEYPL